MVYAWLWRVSMLFIAFSSWWKTCAVVCSVCYFTSFLHFVDLIVLRWELTKDASQSENVKIFLTAGFTWWIYQYLYKRSTMVWIWATQDTVMLVCSLPIKSRKRLAHDTLYVFASCADLVYDTTGHKKWQLSRSCFQDFNTLIFEREREKKQGKKWSGKLLGVCISFPFYW